MSGTTYKIVAFSAEKNFRRNHTLFGLPVVPLEDLEKYYNPSSYKAFVAVSYTKLNSLRQRLYSLVKTKKYTLCSCISPKASIGNNVDIGDNCFLLENVTIQRGAKIGNNTTIWSGSVIGHRSVIGDNCFVASNVAISGFCNIGNNCFLGVNSCFVPHIKVGANCIIGAAAVVLRDVSEGKICIGNPAKPIPNESSESFISGEDSL